ncbi:DUF6491 family protein [Arenimonas donghaensis]|uniref:Lipoprotein n=1 Tax=Arenimonas donghaensis DSM 18148 = HO3-R19 TaxID=1121014 RepID=A0A087MKQ5_9GAMM|nr:DUF6491 family protein [Arenimonas donghaensis]KFL37458.1 hypothetical protein N788_09705 [Arenimonas donghaensis DSM 18148 = HO3-R19]
MRPVLVLPGLLALLVSAACSPGPGSAPRHGAITHPSQCLDPDLARGWTDIDNVTLLVDAGVRKYRVRLAEPCFALGTSPELRFIGDSISNRVCGHLGEYVVSDGQRCRIDRVERLDDDAYARALAGDEADDGPGD